MLSLLQNVSVVSTGSMSSAPSVDSIKPSAVGSHHSIWDFKVRISSGHLDGETFAGHFSCDLSLLTGTGVELVSPAVLEFFFGDHRFQAMDDVHYPLRPTIKFVDGELAGLDYQVWIQRCFGINQGSFWYEGGQGVVTYCPRT